MDSHYHTALMAHHSVTWMDSHNHTATTGFHSATRMYSHFTLPQRCSILQYGRTCLTSSQRDVPRVAATALIYHVFPSGPHLQYRWTCLALPRRHLSIMSLAHPLCNIEGLSLRIASTGSIITWRDMSHTVAMALIYYAHRTLILQRKWIHAPHCLKRHSILHYRGTPPTPPQWYSFIVPVRHPFCDNRYI